jgi:16S rRNA (cytosine1402-N4)-methyltransferase
LNAYRVVNEYDDANLKRVFLDYGELEIALPWQRTLLRLSYKNNRRIKEVLKPLERGAQ